MSSDRKRRNWTEFIEPHVCRHNDQKDFLIEWCICPLGEDHWHDDVRIEDHRSVREDDLGQLGDLGWWQNPVTQTLRETPVMLAERVAENPVVASDSDKLRSVADWIDVQDAKHEHTGTEVQDFLRGLADKLDLP